MNQETAIEVIEKTLDDYADNRKTIFDGGRKKCSDERVIKEVERIFEIASKLTEVAKESIRLEHPAAIDTAGALTALIKGITFGEPFDEVEKWVEMRKNIFSTKNATIQ